MDEVKYISSIQNPLVKKVSLLKEKKSGRRKSGLFVVEGQQEIRMALEGDYHIETLFFYTQIISEDAIMHFMEGVSCVPEIIKVSKEVYQRIAYRKKTEGILAIARTNPTLWTYWNLKEKSRWF